MNVFIFYWICYMVITGITPTPTPTPTPTHGNALPATQNPLPQSNQTGEVPNQNINAETRNQPIGAEDDASIEDITDNTNSTNWSQHHNPTVMRFTYDESDPLGPPNWEELPGAEETTNYCGTSRYTPLQIVSSKSKIEEYNIEHLEDSPRLNFRIHKKIEKVTWNFGHPPDIYNGIQISPSHFGSFQVYDDYKSHYSQGKMKSRMYDFTFAHISYCDYSKPTSGIRSSHQIDGKKFPVEINMLFFWAQVNFGIDLTMNGANKDSYVMVSILGQIKGLDNPRWDPVIRAAEKFRGLSFEAEYNMIPIEGKFSPSWLVPRNTTYYFYNTGSFPVPPCFKIPRVYVLTNPISISERQFQVLTHIKSAREKSGILSCTLGSIQSKTDPELIFYNPSYIKFFGKDRRPQLQKGSIQDDENNHNSLAPQTSLVLISLLTIYLAKKAYSW